MGIKDYLTKKFIKHKTKDMPKEQQEQIQKLFEANPQLMEKISKEVEHKVKKEGKDQMAASMEVMRKYQGELQKTMGRKK